MKRIRYYIWEMMRRLDKAALDCLYPPRCPVCDRVVLPGEGLCAECKKTVPYVRQPSCLKCGKPILDRRKEFCADCGKKSHTFVQAKALWVYEGKVKASLYRFKYQNKREYARVYAEEMARRYGAWIGERKIEAVIPVPLHKNRRRARGYNQAEILARELGAILGLPVYQDLLVRARDTKPQKTLNGRERKNNLKNSFKTTQNIVQLKYILLVDDIYTTGSTLDAAADALVRAGAANVYACCVSIGRDG